MNPLAALNMDDLDRLRGRLVERQVAEVYEALAARGYRYARLAEGVVKGDTFSGRIALEFLAKTAEDEGMFLSEDDLDAIRIALANAYLDVLSRQIVQGNSVVTREVSAEEAWAFHSEVFVNRGLGPDAWTLNTPYTLMDEEGRSLYWSAVLRGAGDFAQELVVGVAADFVVKQAALAAASEGVEKRARSWLHRLHNLDTYLAAAEVTSFQLERLVDHLPGGLNGHGLGSPRLARVLSHLQDWISFPGLDARLADLEKRLLDAHPQFP